MQQIDYSSLDSAMQGYTPPSSQPQQSGGSPLSGILGAALNILPFIVPEIGIPARMVLGGIASAASDAIQGKPLNIAQDALSGISDGIMGGVMGGGKAAADVAGAVGSDVAGTAAADTAGTAASDLAGTATNGITDNAATDVAGMYPKTGATDIATENPTNLNPEINMGHINFNSVDGNPVIDTNNAFTPEPQVTNPQVESPSAQSAPPRVTPPIQPATGSEATSRYTPQSANANPQLSSVQQMARNEGVKGMITTMQGAGMKVDNATLNNLANQALDLGYNHFPTMARDAQTLTGRDYGVDNAVNNMVKQASIGDSAANPTTIDLNGVVNDNARNDIVNQATRGTTGRGGGVAYTDAQRSTLSNNLQDQNVTLVGAGKNGYRSIDEAVAAGDLIKMPTGGYELTSQSIHNLNPSDVLQAQRNLSKMAQSAKTSGESDLYQMQANNLNDKLGQINITKEGAQNVLSNLQDSGFAVANPTQFAKLQQGLSDGTISNINQLRSFTAPWVKASVAYSKATGGASIFDLAAGSRGGLSKGIMNSGTAGKMRVNIAKKASELLAKPGESTAFNGGAGNVLNKVSGGVKNMSPLAQAALIAGIGGAGVLGVNGLATANGGAQAQAELNSPDYQKTQAILNQSNALQRYLGQQGEIRSIFAPTFDTNAGQAGTQGQAMLQAANQNQAARTAAANLLMARAQMGQGGLLGGLTSMIPGTQANAYAQQASNAQAQLNALGIAGNAPSAAQSGASIPSLGSMANAVGNF
jgi:hypothetical protein